VDVEEVGGMGLESVTEEGRVRAGMEILVLVESVREEVNDPGVEDGDGVDEEGEEDGALLGG